MATTLGSIANAPATLYIGDGALSTPSITFGADTDTGIYRNSSNDLRITSGGVNSIAFRISDILTLLPINASANSSQAVGVSSSFSGGMLGMAIDNQSNTVSSDSRMFLRVGGASAGDPYEVYSISGVTTWAIGIDNSDSDKFKISNGATLGVNDFIALDTTGKTGFGTSSPGARFHFDQANATGFQWYLTKNGIATEGLAMGASTNLFQIHSNAASTVLELGINGTGYMSIGTTGKIGVNTAPPSGNYQMRIDATNKLGISIVSGASSSAAYLFLENDSANTWNLAMNGSATAQANKMDVAYNGTVKVRFDLNGPVNFSDGSAAAPAMSFINETATGIYRSASNQIGFSANGTLRAQLDNALRLTADLTPTVDITYDNGNSSHRWLNIWGQTIHSGDIQMENDWRITEGEKIGHPEEGVMFLSPSGKKYKIMMTEVE